MKKLDEYIMRLGSLADSIHWKDAREWARDLKELFAKKSYKKEKIKTMIKEALGDKLK